MSWLRPGDKFDKRILYKTYPRQIFIEKMAWVLKGKKKTLGNVNNLPLIVKKLEITYGTKE